MHFRTTLRQVSSRGIAKLTRSIRSLFQTTARQDSPKDTTSPEAMHPSKNSRAVERPASLKDTTTNPEAMSSSEDGRATGRPVSRKDTTNPEEAMHSSEDRRRKWFDDVGLEDSPEIRLLSSSLSSINFSVSDSSADPELGDLVKCANEPPKNPIDQRDSLDKLIEYLGATEQEESEKKKKAAQPEHGSKPVCSAITEWTHPIFNFVTTFLRYGLKALETTLFIAGELTFQTHYEVALKAILLFVTAYDSARDLSNRIRLMFRRIAEYAQEMRALLDNIKSGPMLRAINKLFVTILAFIVGSGSYMKHGTLSKMVTYLGGENNKLDGLIKSVIDDYAEVTRVTTVAQVMINLSSHDALKRVGNDTALMRQQLSLLSASLTPGMGKQLQSVHDHSVFQAELHVQNLGSEIFEEPYEPSREMGFNERDRISLSKLDRWPRHLRGLKNSSFIPQLAVFGDHPRPLLWISGHIARRNVSWVSSFCVDLVSHFSQFSSFDTVYTFCKRGKGERYSPTLLIKGLAIQLLKKYPIISTRNINRLSKNRFSEIGSKVHPESGELAWQLLEDILRLIGPEPDFRGRLVMIVIDRLELCVSEDGFSVLHHLIPRLQSLSSRISRVQVLITTARISPFGIPTLRKDPQWLRAYEKTTQRVIDHTIFDM